MSDWQPIKLSNLDKRHKLLNKRSRLISVYQLTIPHFMLTCHTRSYLILADEMAKRKEKKKHLRGMVNEDISCSSKICQNLNKTSLSSDFISINIPVKKSNNYPQ